MHEIGHILGLGHSEDPLSPMFTHGPSNVRELTTQDIANVQAIHGPRAIDSNEGTQGNETIAKASSIKGGEDDDTVAEGFAGSQVWIQFGDLHNAQDRDVYEIRTAIGYTGPMAVEVRTQGLSQARLSAELTDRNGNVLASVDPTSPIGVSVLVLPATSSAGKYYLHVRASADPFWSAGDYSITIASPATLAASSSDIVPFVRNAHRWYYDSEEDARWIFLDQLNNPFAATRNG